MKTKIRLALVLIAGTALIGCNSKDKKAASSAAMAGATPNLPVITLATQDAILNADYPATLEGQQNVDIRPKIDGFIQKIFVDEGATVSQGQPLFAINAPQYEQAVRTAQAAMSSAEAEVNLAQLQYNKTKPLVDKEIISKYELESAALALTAKKANLAQAKAALVNAKVNLGYTIVNSPVNGVIGNIPYKVGALVSSNSPEPLTTVTAIAKVYAYFSLNEKQLLEISRNIAGKNLAEKIKTMPPVTLVLADGTEYSEKGKVETISGQVNTATGSSSLRATFPNANGLLRSGASAAIRIPQNLKNVMLVPQKSTTDIQGKKFVYMVNDTGGVVVNNIEIMNQSNGKFFVVTNGLKAGDKIILEGFSSLKDGDKIKSIEKNSDSVLTAIKK